MAMNQIRHERLLTIKLDQIIREGIQVIPKLLFGKIAGAAHCNANNTRVVRKLLDRLRVGAVNTRIIDQPGYQIHSRYLLHLGQCSRQLDHIEHLPSCISVAAELQI